MIGKLQRIDLTEKERAVLELRSQAGRRSRIVRCFTA